MRLQDVGCLVTGASQGIGRAIAVEAARRGARVAMLARSATALEQACEEVEAIGGRASIFPADVRNEAALRLAVDAAAAWAGGLGLAVVNAGVGVHGALAALPATEVARVIEVNLLGAMNTVRAALPHLLVAPSAALVAVSSLAGLIQFRGGGAYGASKAALIAALRALRLELDGSGVRVGWLCPGPVATSMIVDGVPRAKLPRLAQWTVPVLSTQRVAEEVLRLADRGGQRVIPLPAAFLASFARHFPRLAERVELLTGAGEP